MRINHITVLIGIISMAMSCYGQKNFEEGYILIKGDTIKGFIDYKNWSRNPKEIDFKKNENDSKITYNPMSIDRFGVSGEEYVGAIIKVESSPYTVSELEDSPELTFRTDTVFMQTLTSGIKNLFRYEDRLGKLHFVIGAKGNYEPLIHKQYYKTLPTGRSVFDVNQFVYQISQYLSDCPTIQGKLKGLQYKKSDLLDVFEAYSACTQTTMKVVKEKSNEPIGFGLIAGLSITTVGKFAGGPSAFFGSPLSRASFNSSSDFTGGVFAEFFFPRSRKKWSSYNEFLYTHYTLNGYAYDDLGAGNFMQSNYFLSQSYLKLNAIIRYYFVIGKLSVFANVGPSLGLPLTEEANRLEQRTVQFSTDKTTTTQGYFTNALATGFVVGTGIIYGKISLEARGEVRTPIASLDNLRGPISSLYVLAGLRF